MSTYAISQEIPTLNDLRVVELRTLCRSFRLPLGKRKSDYYDIFMEHLNTKTQERDMNEVLAIKIVLKWLELDANNVPYSYDVKKLKNYLRSGTLATLGQLADIDRKEYTIHDQTDRARAPTSNALNTVTVGVPRQENANNYQANLNWLKTTTQASQDTDEIKFAPSYFYKIAKLLEVHRYQKISLIASNEEKKYSIKFHFAVTEQERFLLSNNSKLRVYLLSGALDKSSTVSAGALVRFPETFEISINNFKLDVAKLQGLKNQIGTAVPADITGYIKTGSQNSFVLNYISKKIKFLMYFAIVEEVPIDALVQKVVESPVISTSQTLKQLQKDDSPEDIIETSNKVTLKCPLSLGKMHIAAKSIKCDHLPCFDLKNFLSYQNSVPSWTCPLCSKHFTLQELAVDEFMQNIIDKTSPDVESVIIEDNGHWRIEQTNNKSAANNQTVAKQKEQPQEIISISDSESESEAEDETQYFTDQEAVSESEGEDEIPIVPNKRRGTQDSDRRSDFADDIPLARRGTSIIPDETDDIPFARRGAAVLPEEDDDEEDNMLPSISNQATSTGPRHSTTSQSSEENASLYDLFNEVNNNSSNNTNNHNSNDVNSADNVNQSEITDNNLDNQRNAVHSGNTNQSIATLTNTNNNNNDNNLNHDNNNQNNSANDGDAPMLEAPTNVNNSEYDHLEESEPSTAETTHDVLPPPSVPPPAYLLAAASRSEASSQPNDNVVQPTVSPSRNITDSVPYEEVTPQDAASLLEASVHRDKVSNQELAVQQGLNIHLEAPVGKDLLQTIKIAKRKPTSTSTSAPAPEQVSLPPVSTEVSTLRTSTSTSELAHAPEPVAENVPEPAAATVTAQQSIESESALVHDTSSTEAQTDSNIESRRRSNEFTSGSDHNSTTNFEQDRRRNREPSLVDTNTMLDVEQERRDTPVESEPLKQSNNDIRSSLQVFAEGRDVRRGSSEIANNNDSISSERTQQQTVQPAENRNDLLYQAVGDLQPRHQYTKFNVITSIHSKDETKLYGSILHFKKMHDRYSSQIADLQSLQDEDLQQIQEGKGNMNLRRRVEARIYKMNNLIQNSLNAYSEMRRYEYKLQVLNILRNPAFRYNKYQETSDGPSNIESDNYHSNQRYGNAGNRHNNSAVDSNRDFPSGPHHRSHSYSTINQQSIADQEYEQYEEFGRYDAQHDDSRHSTGSAVSRNIQNVSTQGPKEFYSNQPHNNRSFKHNMNRGTQSNTIQSLESQQSLDNADERTQPTQKPPQWTPSANSPFQNTQPGFQNSLQFSQQPNSLRPQQLPLRSPEVPVSIPNSTETVSQQPDQIPVAQQTISNSTDEHSTNDSRFPQTLTEQPATPHRSPSFLKTVQEVAARFVQEINERPVPGSVNADQEGGAVQPEKTTIAQPTCLQSTNEQHGSKFSHPTDEQIAEKVPSATSIQRNIATDQRSEKSATEIAVSRSLQNTTEKTSNENSSISHMRESNKVSEKSETATEKDSAHKVTTARSHESANSEAGDSEKAVESLRDASINSKTLAGSIHSPDNHNKEQNGKGGHSASESLQQPSSFPSTTTDESRHSESTSKSPCRTSTSASPIPTSPKKSSKSQARASPSKPGSQERISFAGASKKNSDADGYSIANLEPLPVIISPSYLPAQSEPISFLGSSKSKTTLSAPQANLSSVSPVSQEKSKSKYTEPQSSTIPSAPIIPKKPKSDEVHSQSHSEGYYRSLNKEIANAKLEISSLALQARNEESKIMKLQSKAFRPNEQENVLRQSEARLLQLTNERMKEIGNLKRLLKKKSEGKAQDRGKEKEKDKDKDRDMEQEKEKGKKENLQGEEKEKRKEKEKEKEKEQDKEKDKPRDKNDVVNETNEEKDKGNDTERNNAPQKRNISEVNLQSSEKDHNIPSKPANSNQQNNSSTIPQNVIPSRLQTPPMDQNSAHLPEPPRKRIDTGKSKILNDRNQDSNERFPSSISDRLPVARQGILEAGTPKRDQTDLPPPYTVNPQPSKVDDNNRKSGVLSPQMVHRANAGRNPLENNATPRAKPAPLIFDGRPQRPQTFTDDFRDQHPFHSRPSSGYKGQVQESMRPISTNNTISVPRVQNVSIVNGVELERPAFNVRPYHAPMNIQRPDMGQSFNNLPNRPQGVAKSADSFGSTVSQVSDEFLSQRSVPQIAQQSSVAPGLPQNNNSNTVVFQRQLPKGPSNNDARNNENEGNSRFDMLSLPSWRASSLLNPFGKRK